MMWNDINQAKRPFLAWLEKYVPPTVFEFVATDGNREMPELELE